MPSATPARTVADRCRKATFKAPGHLSVARYGFRPDNRRCFGAASAEGRSKLQSRVEGGDIKVEV
jgi:hypothetical protein